jgi:hypothetical protein
MNDLIRPALYSAYHHVLPVQKEDEGQETELFHVVGKHHRNITEENSLTRLLPVVSFTIYSAHFYYGGQS